MKKICQSCFMPMTKTEDFGLEANGNVNFDYCCYCYIKGVLQKDITIDQLTKDVRKMSDVELERPG